MKKLVLASLVLWQFNCLKAQTSIYHTFPSDSAVWYQDGAISQTSGPIYYDRFYEMIGRCDY